MERDTNHLLNKGYSVNEILATILHSVMENYLKKVAVEGSSANIYVSRAQLRGTGHWWLHLNSGLVKKYSYLLTVI